MKAVGIAVTIVLGLIVFGIGALVVSIAGRGCSFANDAMNTVQKEVSPSALLKKYEWFKDASAKLDARKSDIAVFESRVHSVRETYGADATKYPRDVREQISQSHAELSGLKASFNSLAAEYNASMAKINWRFTNVGDLPAGATQPLPREFKQYETK